MIGKTSGRLTVKETFFKTDKRGKKVKYFLCGCECGNEKLVRSDGITSGRIKSCGCLHRELASEKAKAMGEANKSHGFSRTRQYKIWDNMRSRCTNPKDPSFNDYGGRGITYDPKWETFEGFWEDMAEGYSDNLTIERIDVNKDYTKDNCTWVTMFNQQGNKRNTIYLEYNGIRRKLTEWSKVLGVKEATLRTRYRKGWSDEEVLFGRK